MSVVLEFLKDAVEDLITLEVATLTHPTDEAIPLKRTLDEGEQAKLDAVEADLNSAQNNLVDIISAPVQNDEENKQRRTNIRAQKKVVKEHKKIVDEIKDALGIYDPKDIFSKIRAKLDNAELVAYSRFELEGDSVNFINNKESLKDIAASHKDMVAASQEARKALFDMVSKAFG